MGHVKGRGTQVTHLVKGKTQGNFPKTQLSANSELVRAAEFCPKKKPGVCGPSSQSFRVSLCEQTEEEIETHFPKMWWMIKHRYTTEG